MAKLSVDGLDGLIRSLEAAAELPDGTAEEILRAGAQVLVRAQKESARGMGVEDTGLTIQSIQEGRMWKRAGGRVLYITPSGTRRRGKKRVRNAEIAFINEYGTRKQAPRPFIQRANEKAGQAACQAQAAVYDRWLKEKEL